ncbi:phosphatidylserine decarboxylase-domain-containing protein [Gamsiella multidivaricata]|uniref:phosphatidylserine decarboxylase-domain-containing protein n=1 Tax=Gamsiella multidivaricata TaxID=101098 RepID=UPI00221EE7A9|nr:phosphatidylserine decarboxylase-domain-containing protein [Gamsiella multidivaricata]KAI7816703.1 phosphatidylserine decarboxylase-domain-containing protein [Gamsiella multidivaricata]
MADIPLAVSENDPSLGNNTSRQDQSSPTSTSSTNDLHGIVFMEIVNAAHLPRLRNVTRTGFDMDPFVVISFGKYIFRTRVVRHSLNPVWNAKLMFRVHHGEENFSVKFSLHDWDKFSGNDHVGAAILPINSLIQAANEQEEAPVYPSDPLADGADPDMREHYLNIVLDSNIKIATMDPHLCIRAKFVPYTTLRRRFWLSLAKAYNADNERGRYSKVLIQTMLEGLGSTLSSKTIDSFFAPFNKNPEKDELTFDELFERLERQVKLDDRATAPAPEPVSLKKWFRRSRSTNPLDTSSKDDQEGGEEDQEDAELYRDLTRSQAPRESSPQAADMVEPTEADFDPQSSEGEHVIRISTCPICHDAGLGHKLETDVITHIAVCSGNDGFNMDKLILGNFVTEANAQRKWITKVVKSLGYGRYVVGKSNANIIVQDRATGAMLEEKMPTFVRLGIRLLYKSHANKIGVGKILADMSRKQGLKFDDPRSKRDIEPFIRFHNLEAQMMEVLEPVQNFKNFNEFFYRKLKASARTLASPGDDRVAVSVADCRMTCFQTISDAQKFWIKGRQFTIAKMLADEELAKKYVGGSLAIFRLAPQDYHRYHIPVKGVLSESREIVGEYYTVNPMAIRSQLDVYGENKRTISTIESKEFGTVAYVAIGAMMVGSIILTTKGGQAVERMDEHGYFAFGGSTVVVLFEPNSIHFDEDLLRSSKEQIEMLVKVGMRVGVSTRA